MITKTHLKLFKKMNNTLKFLEENYSYRFDFTDDKEDLKIIQTLLDKILEFEDVKKMNNNDNVTGSFWSDEEIKKLLEYAIEGHSLKKQAKLLKRTKRAVSSKRSKLGLKQQKWTNNDIQVLIMCLAGGNNIKDIAEDLKKPVHFVELKIKNLGLNTNKEGLKGIV